MQLAVLLSLAAFIRTSQGLPAGTGDVYTLPLEYVRNPEFETPEGIAKFARASVIRYKDDGSASQCHSPSGCPPSGSFYPVDIENLRYGQYRIGATVGTPGKEFKLSVDTTAGNVWIPGKDCTSWACIQTEHKYDPSDSSSSKKVNDEEVQVSSGSGSARGTLYRDVMNITGIVLEEQGFLKAEEMTLPFISSYDGVFGLGRKDPSNNLANNDVSPFYKIWEKGILREPQFGIYLPPNVSDTNLGEIMFGGSDNYKIEDHTLFNYLPVKEGSRFWEVEFNGFAVEDRLNVTVGSYAGAILDTASPAILLPKQIYDLFSKAFAAATGVDKLGIISCDLMNTAPSLQFLLNNELYEVPANRYIVKGPPGCMLGVAQIGDDQEFVGKIVLGSPFLRTYYSTYDVLRNEVSLAKAKVE